MLHVNQPWVSDDEKTYIMMQPKTTSCEERAQVLTRKKHFAYMYVYVFFYYACKLLHKHSLPS